MKPRLLAIALTSAVFATAVVVAQERRAAPPTRPSPAVKPTGNYKEDAAVVHEAQQKALELAQVLAGKAQDPKAQAAVSAAIAEMERAIKLLDEAKDNPTKLTAAVAAEQAAYAHLLKLAPREINVSQKKGQKGQQSGSQQSRQRQLDQLDLKMSENKYEQQRLAQDAKQSPEQREQLQVLNRLQELARRQQDLNERLKELQTALQEAKSEQETEDIRRRLKRLQEEEQKMLADVDELRQRMDRQENQSKMQQESKQLDQTRQDVQRAAEAMQKGNVQQALASGTRAERDLEKMRDEMRKKTSNAFSEEMRQMRLEARELAQKQEQIGRQLDQLTDNNRRKSLTDTGEKQELVKQFQEQKQHLTNLVDRAKEISERAEQAEPLLHKQLYDAVRKNAQADAANLRGMTEELLQRGKMLRPVYELLEKNKNTEPGTGLEIAAELMKNGFLPETKNIEERSRRSIDEFKRGVERAAESVLGDEAEALRMARKEVEALAEAVRRELAQAEPQGEEAQAGKPPGKQAGQPSESGPKGQPGGKSGEPKPGAGKPGEPKQGEGKQADPKQGEGKQGDGQPGEPQPGQGNQGQGKQGEGKQGDPQAQNNNPQDGKQAGRQPGQQPGENAGKQGGKSGKEAGQPNPDGSRDRADLQNRVRNGGDGGGARRTGGFDEWLGNRPVFPGPIRGEDYLQWSDRLRDVEEMIELPDLRLDVQRVREEARRLRQEARQEPTKPDWVQIRTKIVAPLAEVSKRLGDEIAKRESKEALVPIDRDPVPGKFGELVRRYYEELGRSKN
ncbi:MAG: hypothetical protein FJ386_06590 [Verrucomicrobia bacterium]|nr:hypothetical protein [Verrucomicrobiota bacterium]